MAWYTRPQDGASVLNLPYSTFLQLEEAKGGFVLTWVQEGAVKPLNQWSIHTASLYEARARSMEIIHGALKEMATYLTSSLPVIAYNLSSPLPVTGCYKPIPPSCPCEGTPCKCSKPVYRYSLEAQR